MVEWSITTVLKTVVPRGTGGSNPSLSAKISVTSCKATSYADFLCIHRTNYGRFQDLATTHATMCPPMPVWAAAMA